MNINVQQIIKEKNISIFFQPIISITDQSVIGFEALTRCTIAGAALSPTILFEAARAQGLIRELDYICHEKSLNIFRSIFNTYPHLLLFINFDTSYVEPVDAEAFIKLLSKSNLPVSCIVIEINEIKAEKMSMIKAFASECNKHHLSTSLDDVGSGFSNLDRIAQIKPNIIKIDKELAYDVNESYIKQEIIKSIIDLSHNTGAITIVEGIETHEAFQTVVSLGAQFIQGFYFERPQLLDNINIGHLTERIKQIRSFLDTTRLLETPLHSDPLLRASLSELCNWISKASVTEFSDIFSNYIQSSKNVECIYVLDDKGIQITESILNYASKSKSRRACPLFKPAGIGTNHSIKKYYTALAPPEISKSITSRYLSMATGNSCATHSMCFENNERLLILCIDIIVE